MKKRYAFLLFLIAFILQASLLNVISIFNVTPNLILCMTIVFCYMFDNAIPPLVSSVCFSLLYDYCFAQYTGISSLILIVVGISAMILTDLFSKENYVSILIVVPLETAVYMCAYWAIMHLLGSPYSFIYMLKGLPLNIIYNTVISSILYFISLRVVIKFRQDNKFR